MPTKPKSPPLTMIANITQKLASLVLLPRIFGPMMFPSTCCSTSTITANFTADIGSMMSNIIPDGTAPMKGPKNGIILVTPTTTLTSIGSGSPKRFMAIKHIMPIIMESMILPLIKPPKVSFVRRPSSKIFSARSVLKTASISFLDWAINISLLLST